MKSLRLKRNKNRQEILKRRERGRKYIHRKEGRIERTNKIKRTKTKKQKEKRKAHSAKRKAEKNSEKIGDEKKKTVGEGVK